MRTPEPTRTRKISQVFGFFLFMGLIAGASVLARHQYRQGKGDPQGAFRLARWIFLAQMAIWLCFGHFVPDLNILQPLAVAASTALFTSCFIWILYMALEPFVRKLWPQSIISWTRLMGGRIRDPLVGRDVMFGVMLGLTWVLLSEVLLSIGIRQFGNTPQLLSTDYLSGFRSTLGSWLVQLPGGIQGTLFFFFVLVFLRRLLRNRWAASAAFVALFTTMQTLGSHHTVVDVPIFLMIYTIAAFALVRFGLITLAVAVFVANIMLNLPITFSFSRWYAIGPIGISAGILALGVWGFWMALAGQKVFKGQLLE